MSFDLFLYFFFFFFFFFYKTNILISGDSLGYHDGRAFDTYDIGAASFVKNNTTVVCSFECAGGWWYGGCFHSNLNGDYSGDGTMKAVSWRTFRGDKYSLKRVEMKIRRICIQKYISQNLRRVKMQI